MAHTSAELEDKDKRIMQFIRNSPGGFVGTAEVADELGMTTNGASYRLKELKKQGLIDSRQPSRDEVWYIEASQVTAGQTQTVITSVVLGIVILLGIQLYSVQPAAVQAAPIPGIGYLLLAVIGFGLAILYKSVLEPRIEKQLGVNQ